ncbi:MAG: ankyrin repeat domain-containing protein [Acetatifactor sp.]|nr:ankyrin repeat domain-containing protein [Acetatifactor sp.]
MVYDAEKYRQMRPRVVAGELEVTAADLWIMLHDVLWSICDPEEEAYRHLIDDAHALFSMLLKKLDWDDNEEADIFFEALNEIFRYTPPDKALDMLSEARISFTELMYYRGEPTNIRDFLLRERYSFELLEKMAQLGIDLNSALMKGRTPAYILAKEYSMSGYKDEPDADEKALARAVEEYFSVESLEMLNSLGTSAAHEAVRGNHFLMLSAMLKKGVNVNLTEDSPGVAGNTLLHTACEYCCPGIVRMLMEAGADDTLMNVKEETAAHIAVSENMGALNVTNDDRAEIIRALDHVDIPGKDGMTPLMLAQEYQMHASDILTPVLIEKGADVNRTDNAGNTALLLHTRWSCDRVVIKAMIKAGYHINARNADGNTVLHFAVKNRSDEMAVYLIKKGADYNIANEEQVTPLQMAVENGLDEVLPFMGL